MTNGNAPINVFVQFSRQGNKKNIEFTIANPYILDEKYEGSTSTPTQTPKITETGTQTDSSRSARPASFPYVYLAIVGAAIIAVLALFKIRKR